MKNTNLENLVKSDDYQVFILHCPANVPFIFAIHPWIVCNEKGKISRWEVLFTANKNKSWGHLHLNRLPPFSGIEILPFSDRWFWKGRLLKKIDGELAKKIIEFVESSKDLYPHKDYSLSGTNSNTYVNWVLSHFPEINVKLPWNAFGKNAK